MSRLATFITPGKSLDEAVARVRLAEQLGYQTVFATQIAQRDVLMTLAAYAAGTERITLGSGVCPAFGKHPVALAFEAATLDEMSGGRLILGIGMAHRITMENWYGVDMSKPLSRFKEYVQVLRSLFTTGRVEFAGEFYKTNFGFMNYDVRPDLPIYTASLAPNSLRFAGAAADGVVLWACMPRYIRETVVPLLAEGAREAGRDPSEIEIVAAVPTAVTDDVEAARASFRRDLFVYMTLPFYRRAIQGAGYGDDIAAFDERLAAGDSLGARAAISDALLEHFAAIGTAEQVRAKLAEYREAGATMPAVGVISKPKDGPDWSEDSLKAAIG